MAEAAKFAFSEGTGTPLEQLVCFSAVGRRGKAAAALESALEPIHRLVYGRPGITFERRPALESFQGFPASMEAEVAEKLKKLKKDKLREMVKALNMPVLVSQSVEQVATGVAAFLMAPKETAKAAKSVRPASSSSKKRTTSAAEEKEGGKEEEEIGEKTTKKDSTEENTKSKSTPKKSKRSSSSSDAHHAKKAKHETAAVGSSSSSSSSTPSDDTVRVQVYKRVLQLSPAQRASLGVKALRTELEAHFGLPDGALKDRKDIIAETASDCVKALLEAEGRPLVVAAAAASAAEAPCRPTASNGEEAVTTNAEPSVKAAEEEKTAATTETVAVPTDVVSPPVLTSDASGATGSHTEAVSAVPHAEAQAPAVLPSPSHPAPTAAIQPL